ncbi:MAG: DUF1295 domain-containing protein, partial [Proteobacteria bacterium]|nr:DUF1295 domain-containing protein [Pseudomonadota bacterium]
MSGVEIASYLMGGAYVVGFLALSTRLARKTGRPIWLFGKGAESQALPALLFKLAFAGAIIWPLVLATLGNPFRPDPLAIRLSGTWFDVVGHMLVVIGFCVAIIAQRHMGNSWRIGAAEGEVGVIVDSGPFAISRNPVFLGQAVLFLGLFLVLPSLLQAVLTIALLLGIALQVRIEERVLLQSLGEPYRVYCARVR